MYQRNQKDVPVFSLEVAQKLLAEGFVIVAIKQNLKFTSKLVFYFPRTQKLLDFMREELKLTVK